MKGNNEAPMPTPTPVVQVSVPHTGDDGIDYSIIFAAGTAIISGGGAIINSKKRTR